MTRELIMMKGLPASGKSTFAIDMITRNDKNTIKRINKDDLRAMIDANRYSTGSEKLILEARDLLIKLYLGAGKSVIVDDTNLSPKHYDRLKELAVAAGVQFRVKSMDVDVDECIIRDSKRPNPVGESVIRSMYNKFLKPKGVVFEKRPVDPGLPWAIICDIDGTLAHNDGHRHWTEYDKVYNDQCHEHIKELVTCMADDYEIIMVSGREETDVCREETEKWLHDNFIPFDHLFMRKAKDYRADNIIKKELFDTYIDGNWNIPFVLDDRNRVVDMWRKELKIPCLQCNYGDF